MSLFPKVLMKFLIHSLKKVPKHVGLQKVHVQPIIILNPAVVMVTFYEPCSPCSDDCSFPMKSNHVYKNQNKWREEAPDNIVKLLLVVTT